MLLIGVDRLDYTKGLIQRIEAFDLFFSRSPRLARQSHVSADHTEEQV